LSTLLLTGTAAQADPPRVDWLSINTSFQIAKSNKPEVKKATPAPIAKPLASPTAPTKAEEVAAGKWFDQFDQLRTQYKASKAQQVILNRPLMQQEERVTEWNNTASRISKNYLTLAELLKKLPVPAGAHDLKEYRDLSADWYHDAAIVYDDMIRPRTPAKTIEKLHRQLDEVKKRSQTLVSMTSSLGSMEQELKKQYKVRMVKQDNALDQYVEEKRN